MPMTTYGLCRKILALTKSTLHSIRNICDKCSSMDTCDCILYFKVLLKHQRTNSHSSSTVIEEDSPEIDGIRAKVPKVDLMFHNILQCHSHMVDPQAEAQAFCVSSPADHRKYDKHNQRKTHVKSPLI